MKFIKYLFSKKYRSEYSKVIVNMLIDAESETEAIFSALNYPIAA